MFEMINENIGRLKVPFENIYTSVFTVKTPEGVALIDTATYASDVDNFIVPALKDAGISEEELRYIILTHSHRDHAGGLERLHEIYPKATVVSKSEKLHESFPDAAWINPAENERILGVAEIIEIPGHAKDAVGVMDTRTKTLISGDSLQLYGIFGSGKWGSNIRFQKAHLEALDKLRGMDIERIIASHDYCSLGWCADGKSEVRAYIDQCAEALDGILNFLGAYQQMEDSIIADMYNSMSGKPTVSAAVFAAARERL